MAYQKFYEWRVRLRDEHGDGIDNDFLDPTIGDLRRAKESADADPMIEISLYLRIGNEAEGIIESGEAYIRDGVLDADFDDLCGQIPVRFYAQVAKVFGVQQPHARKK